MAELAGAFKVLRGRRTPRLATGAGRESEAKRQHYRLDSGIGSSAWAAVLANWVPFPLRIRGLF